MRTGLNLNLGGTLLSGRAHAAILAAASGAPNPIRFPVVKVRLSSLSRDLAFEQ